MFLTKILFCFNKGINKCFINAFTLRWFHNYEMHVAIMSFSALALEPSPFFPAYSWPLPAPVMLWVWDAGVIVVLRT
jgi:hypothetical protein